MKTAMAFFILLAVVVAASSATPRSASAGLGDLFTSQAEKDRAAAERIRAETESAQAEADIRIRERDASQLRAMASEQHELVISLARKSAGEGDGMGAFFYVVIGLFGGAAILAIWRWEGIRPGAFSDQKVVPIEVHERLRRDLSAVVAQLQSQSGYGAICDRNVEGKPVFIAGYDERR